MLNGFFFFFCNFFFSSCLFYSLGWGLACVYGHPASLPRKQSMDETAQQLQHKLRKATIEGSDHEELLGLSVFWCHVELLCFFQLLCLFELLCLFGLVGWLVDCFDCFSSPHGFSSG